jgi:hypothetical protein
MIGALIELPLGLCGANIPVRERLRSYNEVGWKEPAQ